MLLVKASFLLLSIVFQYSQFYIMSLIIYIYFVGNIYIFFFLNEHHLGTQTACNTKNYQRWHCLLSSLSEFLFWEAVVSLAMFLINSFIVKKRWKIFVYLPHCLPLHLFTGRSVSFQNGFHFCA